MNTSGTEYFLGNALGSVRQLADASGAVTYSRAYDPYGVVTSTTGTSSTTYGYTGEVYGDSTQLTYLRSRYYASSTGRFITRDTWGGDYNRPLSLNRWNYTSSNPINFTDPSGHCYNSDGSWNWGMWLEWLNFGPCPSTTGTAPVTSTPTLLAIIASATACATPPPTSTSTSIPTSTPMPPTATSTMSLPNLDYDVANWGADESESSRVQRSQWVWDWLDKRGGYWGSGHPDARTLAAFLLVGEGVSLMNVTSSPSRFDGLHVMVWYMQYLFSDGITATDLSVFTAFFNPKRNPSGAWTQEDRDKFQKGPGDYTLNLARGFVDEYWGAGPVYHNGNIVYKWWDNCENFSYTVAFSVDIPIGQLKCGGQEKTKILYFYVFVRG